jgi:hypothetical protein
MPTTGVYGGLWAAWVLQPSVETAVSDTAKAGHSGGAQFSPLPSQIRNFPKLALVREASNCFHDGF